MNRIILVLTLTLWAVEAIGGDPSTVHISKEPVSETELKILKHGDYHSISVVLGRLEVLFKEQGVSSVLVAVPTLNEILAKLQKRDGNQFVELESDLVNFLGKVGDASSTTYFLKAIKRRTGNAAIGLEKLDSAIVDSVIAYLSAEQVKTRNNASRTLVRMYQTNSELFPKTKVELIRDKLIKNIDTYDYKSGDCFALAFFGDNTTLPLLRTIATTDTFQLYPNRYTNREIAQFAITQIQNR